MEQLSHHRNERLQRFLAPGDELVIEGFDMGFVPAGHPGRYGPYVRIGAIFFKGEDLLAMTFSRALEIAAQEKDRKARNVIGIRG